MVNVDKTAEPEGLVTLNLEGLTLSNSSVAPIYVEAIGDEMQISAKSGTTNTISDGTTHTDTYVDSDGNTNTVNGAIFSRNDLKLKGKGTLNVNGNYEDGIVCKNDLKLWNGTIVVHAVDDGIRGKDSVRIGDPTATDYSNLKVTVNTNNGTSGGDGIKSTNDTDENSGYVTINGGTVSIQSYSDGIQAEQAFTMNGETLPLKHTLVTPSPAALPAATAATHGAAAWAAAEWTAMPIKPISAQRESRQLASTPTKRKPPMSAAVTSPSTAEHSTSILPMTACTVPERCRFWAAT